MASIAISEEQIDSLAEKLDSFERSLSPEERRLLAAVFAAARTGMADVPEGEVRGFVLPEPLPRYDLPGPIPDIAAVPLSIGFRSIFALRGLLPEPMPRTP